jgi:hypothetical protein
MQGVGQACSVAVNREYPTVPYGVPLMHMYLDPRLRLIPSHSSLCSGWVRQTWMVVMTPAVQLHRCLPLTSNKNGPDLASIIKQDVLAATSVTNHIQHSSFLYVQIRTIYKTPPTEGSTVN